MPQYSNVVSSTLEPAKTPCISCPYQEGHHPVAALFYCSGMHVSYVLCITCVVSYGCIALTYMYVSTRRPFLCLPCVVPMLVTSKHVLKLLVEICNICEAASEDVYAEELSNIIPLGKESSSCALALKLYRDTASLLIKHPQL